MKKHIFALLLAVAMIVGMIPTTVMATEEAVTNPYKSASLTLTGKPTLVLKYEPKEGDSAEAFTTKFDVSNSEPVVAEENNGLYIFSIELTAARLYSPIKATLFNGETEVGSCEFVLTEYAAKVKEVDPSASDLLDSLMAYSNYAAAYNGTTGTKEFKAAQAITELSGYNSVVTQNSITGIGVIPVLNDACDLYFTFPAGMESYTVKVNNEAVELKSTEGVLDTTKPYYYAIEEILPQNWAEAYVLEVYEGTTLKTKFTYSVLSYVQRKLSSTEPGLADLLKAMYIYHRDAEMFVRTEARDVYENFNDITALPNTWANPGTATIVDGRLNITSGAQHTAKTNIGMSTNPNSDVTVVDVDFTVPSSQSTEIAIYNGDNNTDAIVRFLIQHNALRHVQENSAKYIYKEDPSFALQLNKTHHARIILDMVNQQYHLYIDGVLCVKANVNTEFTATTKTQLRLGIFASKEETVCFDNLKVSKLNEIEKTLYENTFENLDAVNGYSWTWAGNVGVSDHNSLLLQNSASTTSALLSQTPGLTGKFAFEVDVLSSALSAAGTATSTGVTITLGQNRPEVQNAVNLTIYSTSAQYTTPEGVKTVSKRFTANTFYRVKFIVDVDANTYDIYIDNQLVAENVAFIVPAGAEKVTKLDRIRFKATRNAVWNMEFDNLKITQFLPAI